MLECLIFVFAMKNSNYVYCGLIRLLSEGFWTKFCNGAKMEMC